VEAIANEIEAEAHQKNKKRRRKKKKNTKKQGRRVGRKTQN
jgi:hypothetical protein